MDRSFFHTDRGYEALSYQFTLPASLVQDMRLIAQSEAISIHVLASAMYAYLLHTLSEQPSIDMHVSYGTARMITPVRLNFDQYKTMKEALSKCSSTDHNHAFGSSVSRRADEPDQNKQHGVGNYSFIW